jgi:hypothetical protein
MSNQPEFEEMCAECGRKFDSLREGKLRMAEAFCSPFQSPCLAAVFCIAMSPEQLRTCLKALVENTKLRIEENEGNDEHSWSAGHLDGLLYGYEYALGHLEAHAAEKAG